MSGVINYIININICLSENILDFVTCSVPISNHKIICDINLISYRFSINFPGMV